MCLCVFVCYMFHVPLCVAEGDERVPSHAESHVTDHSCVLLSVRGGGLRGRAGTATKRHTMSQPAAIFNEGGGRTSLSPEPFNENMEHGSPELRSQHERVSINMS